MDKKSKKKEKHIVLLEKGDYFGEVALLQQQNFRTASVRAKNRVTLLSLLKPDLENLIEHYPRVGAKVLQVLGLIVANRFSSVTREIQILKYKMAQLK